MNTDDSYTKIVAVEIRAAIAKKGITNLQVSSAIKIPNSTFSRKLSGQAVFTVTEL